jgi:hypothetical protein
MGSLPYFHFNNPQFSPRLKTLPFAPSIAFDVDEITILDKIQCPIRDSIIAILSSTESIVLPIRVFPTTAVET